MTLVVAISSTRSSTKTKAEFVFVAIVKMQERRCFPGAKTTIFEFYRGFSSKSKINWTTFLFYRAPVQKIHQSTKKIKVEVFTDRDTEASFGFSTQREKWGEVRELEIAREGRETEGRTFLGVKLTEGQRNWEKITKHETAQLEHKANR